MYALASMLATLLDRLWRTRGRRKVVGVEDEDGMDGPVTTDVVALLPGEEGQLARLVAAVQARPWVRWSLYVLLAAADVEGNTLLIAAYARTSFASVQLLDALAIPGTVVLSWSLLGRRFSMQHLAGAGVCLMGIIALVIIDVRAEARNHASSLGTSALDGDVMALGGALLLSLSNVGQEFMLQHRTRTEFVSRFCGVAAAIALIQGLSIQWRVLSDLTPLAAGYWAAFTGCMLGMYGLTPAFMAVSGAAAFNLALLTSDLYALLINSVVFGAKPSPAYFAAATLIIAGLGLFTWADRRRLDRQQPST
jgi:solute carrier family 35 protein F1/2